MFIKYTPKVPRLKVIPLIPCGGKTFDNDTVTLRPGTNELTEQEWEAIKPHIKELIGIEIIPFTVAVKEGVKDKRAKTLADVPVTTARRIIQGCNDPKTLQKWFNSELPDELLLVLSKRMRKLKIEPKDLEDDAGDELKDSDITPENESGAGDEDDDLENDAGDFEDFDGNSGSGGNDDADEDDLEDNEETT